MKITKENVVLAELNGHGEKMRGAVVTAMIRRRYTLSNEMALLRQRDEKPEEYATYNEYAETCKTEARAFIASALAEGGIQMEVENDGN